MTTIIGAGLAGLIAANVLHRLKPTILEAKDSLPNNHSAVLRFRTSVVGDATGIPFKKVNMIKTTLPWLNPVADALAYSFKTTKEYRSDRSVSKGELISETRYIAPPDLIARLAANSKIIYNYKLSTKNNFSTTATPIISTIPMPNLMALLEYPKPISFKSVPGKNLHAKIKFCDAYVSLIVPDTKYPFSRISITRDDLIVEGGNEIDDNSIHDVADLLGFDQKQFNDVTIHEQHYAKINPIDDDERRRFMAWATDKFNIYSLGRFATWRPGLLLDDLIQDLRLIEGWITRSDRYDLQIKR